MSVRCPKCGSSNVVGFKNSYECFDCGYLWKKSTLSRSVTIKEFSIPLWAMLLLISIIVIAAAVPASWRLLAQGGITIKAAPTGSIVIETISPQAGDFGSITLEPGEERAITIDFRVDVVGRAYELEGIYVGYNPYPPYKYLSFQVCTYGTSLDTIHLNRCDNHIIQEGRAYSEEGWTYDKLVLSFPKLRPGVYYFRLLFHIEPSYPEQDISFNFKIYINFREAR